jgi:hypothetical protein
MQSTLLEEYLGEPLPTGQSVLLTQFYRAYAAWIDDGAPPFIVFLRQAGLCGNLRVWAQSIGLEDYAYEYKPVRGEMQQQFRRSFVEILHPFNQSLNEWNHEADSHTCHLNTERIKWVRKHAE